MTSCELTHLARQPINVERARAQHADYERALERLGCTVERLPAGSQMPDSVFVEDIAVVFDELAIVTRPGARSRRGEVPGVAEAVAHHRPIVRIAEPGTIDGGDVLVVGRSVFIGRTSRTNQSAIDQMRTLLAPHGYTVRACAVRDCLHLKSAVTALDDHTLLANRRLIDDAEFEEFVIVDVDSSEPMAANIVRVGPRLLGAAAFPETRKILAERGYDVTVVDVSEIAKAEGAVTCCSLIFVNHPRDAIVA
jgi:dimethylargininase